MFDVIDMRNQTAQIKSTAMPAISQVDIHLMDFPKELSGVQRRENADAYSEMISSMSDIKRLHIPDEFTHVTLVHAAISFLYNHEFRTDLFRSGDAHIRGRSFKSQGYFQITGETLENGSARTGRVFKPVDRKTFYNKLAPEERSFHLCSGVGELYVNTDYMNSDSRGLVLFTNPFRSDDAKIALAKKSDLENATGHINVSRLDSMRDTLKKALRTIF
jgi:hypothetical protein